MEALRRGGGGLLVAERQEGLTVAPLAGMGQGPPALPLQSRGAAAGRRRAPALRFQEVLPGALRPCHKGPDFPLLPELEAPPEFPRPVRLRGPST